MEYFLNTFMMSLMTSFYKEAYVLSVINTKTSLCSGVPQSPRELNSVKLDQITRRYFFSNNYNLQSVHFEQPKIMRHCDMLRSFHQIPCAKDR